MDPDAALEEIESLMKSKDKFAWGEAEFWQHDDDRLYELTHGLITWLNKGGAKPKKWAN